MNEQTKPHLNLTESDGNVFFILGRARKAAREAGWTKEQIEAFCTEAMSGDYDKVLQTCMKYFEVD